MRKYHTVWEKEQEEEVPYGVGKERKDEVKLRNEPGRKKRFYTGKYSE